MLLNSPSGYIEEMFAILASYEKSLTSSARTQGRFVNGNKGDKKSKMGLNIICKWCPSAPLKCQTQILVP